MVWILMLISPILGKLGNKLGNSLFLIFAGWVISGILTGMTPPVPSTSVVPSMPVIL